MADHLMDEQSIQGLQTHFCNILGDDEAGGRWPFCCAARYQNGLSGWCFPTLTMTRNAAVQS